MHHRPSLYKDHSGSGKSSRQWTRHKTHWKVELWKKWTHWTSKFKYSATVWAEAFQERGNSRKPCGNKSHHFLSSQQYVLSNKNPEASYLLEEHDVAALLVLPEGERGETCHFSHVVTGRRRRRWGSGRRTREHWNHWQPLQTTNPRCLSAEPWPRPQLTSTRSTYRILRSSFPMGLYFCFCCELSWMKADTSFSICSDAHTQLKQEKRPWENEKYTVIHKSLHEGTKYHIVTFFRKAAFFLFSSSSIFLSLAACSAEMWNSGLKAFHWPWHIGCQSHLDYPCSAFGERLVAGRLLVSGLDCSRNKRCSLSQPDCMAVFFN